MASSIPAALKYWTNLAKTVCAANATAGDVPLVWPSKALPQYTSPLVLQIYGAVDITHAWAELGSQYKVEEHFRIQNNFVAYTGTTPENSADYLMDKIFTFMNPLSVALANDYTMGGALRLCLPITQGELIFSPDTTGRSMATLNWFIHCEQRIVTLS